MILRLVLLVLVFAVAGCGDKAAAPVAVAGNDVAAEAVADVDAAMAEVQRGERTLAAPAPAK